MRGAQRAAALTQRLLAFSRRQPLDPKPVNVNRLVAGMSELLRRSLGEHIEIETVLGAGLWWTLADPNQLENALLNLAVNARDAMPEGGKLTIETGNAHLDELYAAGHAEITTGQYVQIAVSDTGAGMSPEVLAQAFEPFFTTKDAGHGTGLGLSQVYGFVKQSGGHVKLYSEPGQGTTVKVYLPRHLVAREPVDATSQGSPVARGATSELVILVEDDDDVRRYSAELVRELAIGCWRRPMALRRWRSARAAAFRPLVVHRRRPARRHERPTIGGCRRQAAARSAGALHHGLCAQRHRPWWPPRSWAAPDHQAVHPRRFGSQAARSDRWRNACVPIRLLLVEDEVLVRMVAVDVCAKAALRSTRSAPPPRR